MTGSTGRARHQALRLMLLGMIVIVGGTVRGSAQGRPSEAAPGIAVGQEAPDFELKSLAGGRVRLKDLRGHPVLVNFWASWCGPCATEMPLIVAAYDSLRNQGLLVVAVNLSDQERLKDVRAFVASFNLQFLVLLDERGHARERYRLVSLPTTVFIDTAGLVRHVSSGPMTSGMLGGGLTRLSDAGACRRRGPAASGVPCAPCALPDGGAPSIRATGTGAAIMVLRRRLF